MHACTNTCTHVRTHAQTHADDLRVEISTQAAEVLAALRPQKTARQEQKRRGRQRVLEAQLAAKDARRAQGLVTDAQVRP